MKWTLFSMRNNYYFSIFSFILLHFFPYDLRIWDYVECFGKGYMSCFGVPYCVSCMCGLVQHYHILHHIFVLCSSSMFSRNNDDDDDISTVGLSSTFMILIWKYIYMFPMKQMTRLKQEKKIVLICGGHTTSNFNLYLYTSI